MNGSAELYRSLYDPSLSQFDMPKKPMGIDAGLGDSQEKDMAPSAANKAMIGSGMQSMSAGGSAGQALTGAGAGGMMSGAAGGPYVLAAGLALSYMEQKKQAEAAQERAIIEEATNRKNAVQNAIAGQMSAASMLGV